MIWHSWPPHLTTADCDQLPRTLGDWRRRIRPSGTGALANSHDSCLVGAFVWTDERRRCSKGWRQEAMWPTVRPISSTASVAISGPCHTPHPQNGFCWMAPQESALSRRAMQLARVLIRIGARNSPLVPQRPSLARILTWMGSVGIARRDEVDSLGVRPMEWARDGNGVREGS